MTFFHRFSPSDLGAKMILSVTEPQINYVGIGSRNAPQSVLDTMYRLSIRFAELGFTLRTLNNSEVDKAFYDGCISADGKMSVYVPWIDSSQPKNPYHCTPTKQAFTHCDRVDPNFQHFHTQTKAIKARLANLLFGVDTEVQADFLVCWSPEGAEDIHQIKATTGEISGVLEIKPTYTMPVFNFARKDAMKRLTLLVEKIKSAPVVERETLYQFASELKNNKIIEQISQNFNVQSITVASQPVQAQSHVS
jgi:hypothetical protein